MPELSVVIVNYNTRDLLRACLQALLVQTIPLEIIVVDNASSDHSAAMVQEEFPQVMLLAQEQNTWFCGGNNIGIASATGDYILLLNPDTEAAPDALEHLLRAAKEHPDYAGVTGHLVYPDGKIQRTCSRIPTYAYLLWMHTPLGMVLPRVRQRSQERIWYARWHRDTDYDVDVVPGSCLLMRRDQIRLDDRLKLYFPEDDLAQRVGKPFRYIAAAHITHHEKAATQSWLATRVYFEDLMTYTRKHHGWLAMMLLWLLTRPLLGGMWIKRQLVQ